VNWRKTKYCPQRITHDQALRVIENRIPRGLFFYPDPQGVWIGIDNLTGDAWTEEFHWKKNCLTWLRHEFETGDENH